ncbi:MAG: helix-turn-helix transcriptional regulator [Prolixibacteraceae bacterium]|nr:helix-turn-helix transcriptional regulator [Prolixibacteraceae bacterium]MBN2650592.1 helix-turn-helix transcriptional regulator [Prolixibacteraceae bacterium]
MRERIVEFIEKEGISAAEFADNIGVQRSSVSHVLNGRNNPGFSFIQKILETYPGLNSRWLMTGNGSMYDDSVQKETSAKNVSKHANSVQTDLFSTGASERKMHAEKEAKTTEMPDLTAVSAPEKIIKNATDELPKPKKVLKVLIFYDDHTFDDFRPAE